MGLGMKKVSKILSVVGVFAGALILGMGIFEIVLRFFFPQANPYQLEYHDHGYVWNARSFDDYASVPWAAGRVKRLTTDQDGFRKVAGGPGSVDGARRIVVFGDAISLGWAIEPGSTYTDLLAKNLPGLAVRNASTLINSTARIYQFYRKERERLKPNVLVLQLTTGSRGLAPDYVALDSINEHPFERSFFLSSGQVEILKKYRRPVGNRVEFDLDCNAEPVACGMAKTFFVQGKTFCSDLLHTCRLYEKLRNRRQGVMTPVAAFAGMVTQLLESVPNKEKMDGEATLFYLSRLKEMAAQDSVKILVLLVPNRIGCNRWRAWGKIKDFLETEKIPVIDVAEDLCEQPTPDPMLTPRPSVFLVPEPFPNETAHKIMADKILSALSRMN